MNNNLRKVSISVGRAQGSWLTLLLLLVVLVPSVCLLWFMSRAVQNERFAVRQKLVDAYRGHLSLAQERLETSFRATIQDLDQQAETLSAPALFAGQVRAAAADAVICFDVRTNIVYPSSLLTIGSESLEASWTDAQRLEQNDPASAASAFGQLAEHSTNAALAARALQAQARCLVQAGRRDAALAILTGKLEEKQYLEARDAQGRLLVPNAELMALELLKETGSSQAQSLLVRLTRQLDDYNDTALSAQQRRFLMHEVQRLFPGQSRFATLAAEDLAARVMESGPVRPGEPGLHATALPDVWQLTSARGRVVQLYEFKTLLARMNKDTLAQILPADVTVNFLPPGKESDGYILSLPAGASLPGWRLTLNLNDQRLFDTAADQRIAAYVWIGLLVVATVVILAALALRLVRRQAALTQLKNDLVANVTHELKTPLASMRLLVDTLLNAERFHEPTVREYLQLIARENERLSRLIDNFLTFSRIERNKYAFDFKEVSPARIVEGASAAVKERFNGDGCRFEVQVAPNLPTIQADADALVTALLNLLENAYKYSGDDKRIQLNATLQNGSIQFAVHDNGVGLTSAETKKIFQRFYQVDQRLSRTAGGCGLGLSIVQFIVAAHQGQVNVASQPGSGSVFTIAIPAAAPGQPEEMKS